VIGFLSVSNKVKLGAFCETFIGIIEIFTNIKHWRIIIIKKKKSIA
jgi:hypothetical protein